MARSHSAAGSLAFYLLLVAVWLLPPLLLSLATTLAGGHPHADLFGWPFVAMQSLPRDRMHAVPWHWVGAAAVLSPAVFWTVLIIGGAALFLLLVLLLILLWAGLPALLPLLAFPLGRSRRTTTAKLRRSGLLLSGSGGRRVVIGRHGRDLVAVKRGVSVLVLGPAASGKTAGVCIPAVQEWPGPVVAVSAKSDLIRMTAGLRQLKGRVEILDSAGVAGTPARPWSPLVDSLRLSRALAIAAWMAAGEAPESVVHLLACVLYAAANLAATPADVLSWLEDAGGERLTAAMGSFPYRDPRAIGWLLGIVEGEASQVGSCFSAAHDVLGPLLSPAVGPSPESATFSPRRFLTTPGSSLFVVASTDAARQPSARAETAVVASLLEEARELVSSRRGGLQPFLLVLDDAERTAPADQLCGWLPWLEQLRSTLVVCCRALDGAATLAARATAVLGCGGDRETVAQLEWLAAERARETLAERDSDRVASAARQLRPGGAILLHESLPPTVLSLGSRYRDGTQ